MYKLTSSQHNQISCTTSRLTPYWSELDLNLIFEISSLWTSFSNLIFVYFELDFFRQHSKNRVWNRQKLKFKNWFCELEISKIKCRSTGGESSYYSKVTVIIWLFFLGHTCTVHLFRVENNNCCLLFVFWKKQVFHSQVL